MSRKKRSSVFSQQALVGVVHVESLMALEPGLHLGMFIRRIIIGNYVNLPVWGVFRSIHRRNAIIWLFSSTENTIARWGGFRHSPTMSSGFSANRGSRLILNVSTRCGFKPCGCQIRRTLASLSRAARAMVRVLQGVTWGGFS
jgi:hypothetical protein